MPNEIKCRCCGQPLHSYEQGHKPQRINGVIVNTEFVTLVECHNKNCDLRMVTLSIPYYFTADLEQYKNVIRSAGGAA
jgi:hypothetical protein